MLIRDVDAAFCSWRERGVGSLAGQPEASNAHLRVDHGSSMGVRHITDIHRVQACAQWASKAHTAFPGVQLRAAQPSSNNAAEPGDQSLRQACAPLLCEPLAAAAAALCRAAGARTSLLVGMKKGPEEPSTSDLTSQTCEGGR